MNKFLRSPQLLDRVRQRLRWGLILKLRPSSLRIWNFGGGFPSARVSFGPVKLISCLKKYVFSTYESNISPSNRPTTTKLVSFERKKFFL